MSEKVLLEAKRLIEENLPYEEVLKRLKESFADPTAWEIVVVFTGIK